MFTNLVIRFFWVFYIPQKGSHIRLRSFFFAIAEMLRRWQWNFCKSRVWACERIAADWCYAQSVWRRNISVMPMRTV